MGTDTTFKHIFAYDESLGCLLRSKVLNERLTKFAIKSDHDLTFAWIKMLLYNLLHQLVLIVALKWLILAALRFI